MRSTRATMRSVSSQIRLVSSRSLGRHRLLEQLRRAADAGQRVLDLVRQHRRHRGDRAGGVAVGHLAVDACGRSTARCSDTATSPSLSPIGDSRSAQKRLPMRGELERHAVFGDRAAARQHLLEQREERRVVRHEIGRADGRPGAPRPTPKNCSAAEVDEADRGRRRSTTTTGLRQRIEDRRVGKLVARVRRASSGAQRPCQAACALEQRVGRRRRAAPAPCPASISRLTAARNSAEPGRPFEYQPRCLRAMRTPVSSP